MDTKNLRSLLPSVARALLRSEQMVARQIDNLYAPLPAARMEAAKRSKTSKPQRLWLREHLGEHPPLEASQLRPGPPA